MDKLGHKLDTNCLVILNRPGHKELVVGNVVSMTDKTAQIIYFIGRQPEPHKARKAKNTIIRIAGPDWNEQTNRTI